MIIEKFRYEGSDPVRLLFAEETGLDIDMGEHRLGTDTLLTMGASTCIVLAAHNDETKHGLLGHFSSISKPEEGHSDKRNFHEALGAITHLGNSAETSIFLGGGMPFLYRGTGADTVEPDRLYAQEAVRGFCDNFRLPGDQVSIDWSDPESAIDIELDCATGILIVHRSPKEAMSLVYTAPAETN